MKNHLDLLNYIFRKHKILLIISLTIFSFLYSIQQNSIWSSIIGFISSIFLTIYLSKTNYQFEKPEYPFFTIALVVPMIGMDVFYQINTLLMINPLFFPLSVFVLYASFFISYFIATWISNKIGNLLRNFTREEKICLVIGWLILSLYSIIAYSISPVFGHMEDSEIWDIIFVTDSGIQQDVFFNIDAIENDLRQCLFGLFGRPIYGYAWLCSIITGGNIWCYLCILQNFLLSLSFLLLLKMANINNRILTSIVFTLLFPSLLYAIVLEQYVLSFFFLILLIYDNIYFKKFNSLEYAIATTTLITSAFFIGFPEGKHLKERFLNVIQKALKGFSATFILLILYGRGFVISSIGTKIESLFEFTSLSTKESIGFISKLQQFSYFVKSCFVMPETQIITIQNANRLRLIEINSFNIFGLVFFLLAIIGLFLGYRKQQTRCISGVSLSWITISILCLVIIGWGTIENGLTIYILYFGWPYWIGIVLLIQNIFPEKYHKFVLLLILILSVLFQLNSLNILLEFAQIYYPY